MKANLIWAFLGLSFTFFGCQSGKVQQKLSDAEEALLLRQGDSVALAAQQVLMQNLTQAIKTKGIADAVSFCNLNAISLTDSTAKSYGLGIQRLSEKNRNPQNALSLAADKAAWEKMRQLLSDTSVQTKHFISNEQEGVFYYKAINIAMPTCLSCHGQPGLEISEQVLSTIQQKYPDDKATGYKMNDFRGMWKLALR